ncbi:phospholipid-translocating P-type ATPase [Rhizoctonia solani AG-3 Rhs1AP]|uniref:Phospholipid-transporting ATPase n=2 Tax=Rhizoctonia solani AG-3 TaxID=1086053 RepID=A0A074RSH1_9AGAM|nr:phospholipid-translocating P-type ATPase [Rhizoctonia solani AG-3 Rhs1AP]KEP50076.1 phospholipid-translocating P-type ATPase [Rhizoctonia solani 123E]
MSFFKRHPHLDDDGTDTDNVDPNLRLRTTLTAHSTIAESIRSELRQQRRKKSLANARSKFTFKRPGTAGSQKSQPREGVDEHGLERMPSEAPQPASQPTSQPVGERRTIYVNQPLPQSEKRSNGDPITRYVRNKVRTSKYTIVTFIPKNLYEQFRRIANLYFLALVVLQGKLVAVFPIFGAAAPQIAMVPLVVILSITAAKDGIEDYRRASLDDEVNNSAATKLSSTSWRNPNQPLDPRSWIERILGLGAAPGKVTRGVRRLRAREREVVGISRTTMDSSVDQSEREGRSLEDIQSVTTAESGIGSGKQDHSYPPMPSLMTITADTYASGSAPTFSTIHASHDPGPIPTWERTLWKKLEVGDIVLLRDNDQVPADTIVLATSDADGMAYVETKNLDGETNLKLRKALRATRWISGEEDLAPGRCQFVIDSEPPHAGLYVYNGVLRYRTRSSSDGPIEEKVEPVTINEMLLRGCTLRNTSWVIGMVLFTGADTKIMLNGGATPSKRSKIERQTNFNVVMNFIVLLAMSIVSAVASGINSAQTDSSAWIYDLGLGSGPESPALYGLVTFGSCLIAFQNIVPISLYISIEIVKTIQAYFIAQDRDMYYAPLDTACVPKTWNISDDLGQIAYIFSDKTGTLTQNVMEFMRCSVAGVRYGEGVTEAMKGAAKRRSEAAVLSDEEEEERMKTLKIEMTAILERAFKNKWFRRDKLTMVSPHMARDLTAPNAPQRQAIIEFFRALAVCHTVLPDLPDEGERKLDYKAESPDEAALVAGARDAGFPFLGRSSTAVDIEVMGQPERYIPLKVLEFNSTRKRMSVIVRDPQGRLVLYCKGADSVIYERLAGGQDAVKERTREDMEVFANGGLRTLCIAYRFLSEEEYLTWSVKYDAAAAATVDRDEAIDKANELIEHDLLILGATALEDKLQEGVPDAIEQLHRAGIKLWILTGDKLQTAIEIGYSCNLLKSDMEVMIISATTADGARTQIEAGLNKIASVLGPPNVNRRFSIGTASSGFAVVIDGDTLRFALDDSLKPLFLSLGTQCDTVVCCRVSPAQKAQTVKLVKEGKNAMTLSIGDGANDVAMIQEANIGCGLMGLEGSQAAMSADYAFGQFRFLTKLLLVHGRWSYQRVADMHSNFFYKNVIWTFAMFWFCFWNSFDATYLYQYTFILLYNTVFTSLPVIVLGAFDQDINAKASLAFPQLYRRGILGLEYTQTKFWAYMFDGLYQSAVVYFIPYFVWTNPPALSWTGKGIDSLADFGTTVSVAAIVAANTYVGINTRYWTILTWFVTIGSSAVLIIWIAVYSQFMSVDFVDEFEILFGSAIFWGCVILSVCVAITPRFLVKAITQAYMPLDKDIIREAWVAGDLKDQLGIKHRSRKRRGSDHENSALYHGSHQLSVSEDGYQPGSMSRGDFDFAPTPAQRPSPLSPDRITPPLIVTTPAAEDDNSKTPRAQTFDLSPGSPGGLSYRTASDSHSPSSSTYLASQRSPVMRSIDQTQLTVGAGGEYEMGQIPHSAGHYHDSSVHSRASDRTFITAQTGPSWDDDGSPRAV